MRANRPSKQRFGLARRTACLKVAGPLAAVSSSDPACGRTPEGILARVLARVLALTAAIWHNDKTAQLVMRSLTAYDH